MELVSNYDNDRTQYKNKETELLNKNQQMETQIAAQNEKLTNRRPLLKNPKAR